MSGRKFRRPSPAMVVACIALAISLGGTSYAAITLPRNSVGAKQLKRHSVTGTKLAKNAVTSDKIANGQVTGADVNEATLTTVPNAARAGVASDSALLGGFGPGYFATRLWAHIGSGVEGGSGVVGADCPAAGVCYVTFDRPIRNCAAFATISPPVGVEYGSFPWPSMGTIQVSPVILAGVENRVRVVMTGPDGTTPAGYEFNIMAMC